MSIIIELLEILAAIGIAFAIAFGVYGIISTLIKYEVEKEMEDLVKKTKTSMTMMIMKTCIKTRFKRIKDESN